MRAVVDTSSLISLARSGHLGLLDVVPVELVVLDVVFGEAVADGLAGGHADAAAIESALSSLAAVRAAAPAATVDSAVLGAAIDAGMLLSNDLALGRRARNAGVRWLRTADLVVLAHRLGRLDVEQSRAVVDALLHSGRLTPELARTFLEELS